MLCSLTSEPRCETEPTAARRPGSAFQDPHINTDTQNPTDFLCLQKQRPSFEELQLVFFQLFSCGRM